MSAPAIVRVKISSEAAGAIALTPVLARDMPISELLEFVLAATGKHPGKVRELLRRGSVVHSASRLRWQGFEVAEEALAALLAGFPDPDPGRRFEEARLTRALIAGPLCQVEITREVGRRRRMMRRRSFWDALLEILAAAPPEYRDYSYRERADVYALWLAPPAAQALREAARLLRYSSLESQLSRGPLERVNLFVERPSAGV